MIHDDLGDGESIARYISPMHMKGSRLSARAFCLRLNRPEELGLSVNWLGAFDSNRRHPLAQLRDVFGKRFEIRRSGRFAELRVGDVIRDVCRSEQVKLRVMHTPEPDEPGRCGDPSHAQIFGLPHPKDDPEAANRFAMLLIGCVLELHVAVVD